MAHCVIAMPRVWAIVGSATAMRKGHACQEVAREATIWLLDVKSLDAVTAISLESYTVHHGLSGLDERDDSRMFRREGGSSYLDPSSAGESVPVLMLAVRN